MCVCLGVCGLPDIERATAHGCAGCMSYNTGAAVRPAVQPAPLNSCGGPEGTVRIRVLPLWSLHSSSYRSMQWAGLSNHIKYS